MITFNPQELAALNDRLQDVAEKVAKKALRSAARKGMNKVRKEARDNAPEDTGLLESNFALQTKFKGGNLYARVGVKGGARNNPDSPWYWRFVELGTKDMPARPFMRPALENNAQDVLDTVVEELKKALDKV